MTTAPKRTRDGKNFIAVTVDYYNDERLDEAVAAYAGAADMLFRLTAYSRQNLTDGTVPVTAARRIAAPLDWSAALSALVAQGLIAHDAEAGTYTVSGYANHQQTKEQVLCKRAVDAGYKAAQRARDEAADDPNPSVSALTSGGVSPDIDLNEAMSAPIEVEIEVEKEKNLSSSADAADEETPQSTQPGRDEPGFRPDVDALCDYFADSLHVVAGFKPVQVTKGWRTSMRLLLDDPDLEATPERIRSVIDWTHRDDFWHVNVRSTPTLREKYQVLEKKAKAALRSVGGSYRAAAEARDDSRLDTAEGML